MNVCVYVVQVAVCRLSPWRASGFSLSVCPSVVVVGIECNSAEPFSLISSLIGIQFKNVLEVV